MFLNIDNIATSHAHKKQWGVKTKKILYFFLVLFRPYFQLRDALAAVYFVNGLFQLSLSVARVRPDPPEAEPICSFFDLQ